MNWGGGIIVERCSHHPAVLPKSHTRAPPLSMRHICVARPSRFGFPQAAAAETLLGVASHAATSLAERMPTILGLLWDALLVLDDLTASTGAVLKLLAEFTQVGERVNSP